MPRSILAVAALALIVAACTAGPETAKSSATPNPEPFLAAASAVRASAALVDAKGSAIGTVQFVEERQMTRVDVRLVGAPEGEHGIHVHAVGKCEAPGFTTAGAHFNPAGKVHGWLSTNGPHAGDLGNVTVAKDGRAQQTFFTGNLSTNPGASWSVVPAGSSLSVVLHANPDDDKTDPSGNSGDRIACGVIKQNPT